MKKQILYFFLAFALAQTESKSQCALTVTVVPSGTTSLCGTGTVALTASSSANSWVQKANFGGSTRLGSTGFSVGNKGYIGLGTDGLTFRDDMWEYDPSTNAWTQKANFPGTARRYATGFGIGTKGYVGLGASLALRYSDFYEFDPIANTWTARAAYGGGLRSSATGFSIGSKGYIGCGNGSLGKTDDFWEYDPSLNTWTQKTNFPGGTRAFAVGFGIGTKGYLGTGEDGVFSTLTNDFWEYDPSLNTWTAKANFGGTARSSAVGFSIVNKGYIGVGSGLLALTNDFWEYDPTGNTWVQRANFGGAARQASAGFGVGGKGYIGTGQSILAELNDFWEYNPPVTYSWSSGPTTQSISVSLTNTYVVTITSVAGCTASASQTVAVNPLPTITVNSGSICAGQSFTITPGGANTYTFQGGSAVVSPTSNTNYTVTGTSTAGCVSSSLGTSTITVNALPTITVNSGSICSGQSFTLTPSGANTYTFQGGSAVVSPTTNTNYTVVGTNTAGCISSAFATSTITVNTLPTITVNSGSICSGQSFTLVPGGANTYTFQGGSAVVSPTTNSSYTVVGTSTAGCVSPGFATSNLTVHTLPTITVNSASICVGQSFTMVPSGANTYTFQGGSAVVSPTTNSSYTVVGTSTAGCVSPGFATSNVTVNTIPTISVNSGSICSVNSFTMVPSGASTYTFQGGSAVVNPTANTSYTVAGTSVAGCVSSTFATSNVTVHASPTIAVNSGSICSGNSFTMTPSGANTYSFQGGTAVVSPSTSSNYTVVGTSTAGCVSPNFITSSLTVHSLPTITVNSGSICITNSFTMVPGGANTYTFQGGSAVVSPTSSSSYTVVGTSTAGCVSSGFATSNVTVNTSPTITVNSGSLCSGNSFTLIPGGASTYTFQGGSAVVSPTSNTSYTVTGTTASGCVSSSFATSSLTVHITPTITVNSGSICLGKSFTMTTGGASTYTFQGGNAVVSPTTNSTYTVVGTSTAGCISPNFVTSSITVNSLPTITVNSGSLCSGQSFTMVPSGASTYTFQGGNAVVSPSTSSIYTVIGANGVGCVSSTFATSFLSVFASPTISVNNGTICAGDSFTMIPSGANTYTFQGGIAVASASTTSNYTVVGTSTAGCVSPSSATSNIFVNPLPVIVVNSGSICAGQSFTIFPTGATTYTFQGGFAIILTPSVNSSYTVVGTSTAGCISQGFATSNITVNPVPIITVNSGSICSNTSFTMIPSGAATYTFQGGNPVVSPNVTNSYTVMGTSPEGCVSQSFATSNVTVSPTPTITVNSGSICAGGSFHMSPDGAASFTFQGGNSVVTPTVNTSYTVTGTSIAGCISQGFATANVTVNAQPTITVNSGNICTGKSFTIIPSGASSYTFEGGSSVVSPTANTSYTVVGTSSAGCVSTGFATSNVTVNISPTITVNSGSICSGDSFTMIPTGANSYTFQGGAAVVNPTTNTNYTVVGTSSAGCVSASFAISNVTVSAIPNFTVNSGAICVGESFTIIPDGASSYTFEGGSNIVSPTTNTNFTVTATGEDGCVSPNFIVSTITVNALPIISVNSGSICLGASFFMSPSGANSYTFQGGKSLVAPSSNSSYTVVGTSSAGCVSATFATASVSVNPNPSISITSDVEIAAGSDYQLNPTQTGATSYSWSPSSYLNSASIINPIASPPNTITYIVTAYTSKGCKASDTINIKVLDNVIIANYMSPNGDGANDVWKISSPTVIKDYSVEIIDSYYQTVYKVANNYNNDFDGKRNGVDLPDGVYYYFIKDGDKVKYKGSITLTR